MAKAAESYPYLLLHSKFKVLFCILSLTMATLDISCQCKSGTTLQVLQHYKKTPQIHAYPHPTPHPRSTPPQKKNLKIELRERASLQSKMIMTLYMFALILMAHICLAYYEQLNMLMQLRPQILIILILYMNYLHIHSTSEFKLKRNRTCLSTTFSLLQLYFINTDNLHHLKASRIT